jgi:hypothetical protein
VHLVEDVPDLVIKEQKGVASQRVYEFLCPRTKATLILEQDLLLETAQRIMPPLTPNRRYFSLAANGFPNLTGIVWRQGPPVP